MSDQVKGREHFKKVAYEAFIFFLVVLVAVHTYLFKKDYVNRLHLRIVWMGRKLQVSWWKHEDFVAYNVARLSEALLEQDPEDFISFALTEAKDCNYLIFHCGDADRYIRFWLGDGDYTVHWRLKGKKNKLQKYTYPMLGVLNEMDITQRPIRIGGPMRTQYRYYEVRQESEFTDYEIHFTQGIDEAAQFAVLVLTKVFKQDLKKVQFRLG